MSNAISRRQALAIGLVVVSAAALSPSAFPAPAGVNHMVRMRVIVDNDFGGDPDGLFQLAHFLLCDSVTVPLVVGTHYRDFGPADLVPDKARASAEKAEELIRVLSGSRRPPVLAGTAGRIASRETVHPSPATAQVVREAMRSDVRTPLYYAAGGSLTEIALAWLAEPAIGKRLKLLWIGGSEHAGLALPPPGPIEPEYNFSLDPLAAQIIFNDSDIEIWQVPRNAFRQMLFSLSELDVLAQASALGRYLKDQVEQTTAKLSDHLPKFLFSEGETFGLGDCALVTLTALQSAFQPDPSSSSYQLRATPRLNPDGTYAPRPEGRPMRIYSTIDAGLTFRDMVAKFARANRPRRG